MNDSDFENQLRSLTPASPTPGLGTQIEKQLNAGDAVIFTSGRMVRPSHPSSAGRWWRDLGWAMAGAAAMLVGITLFSAGEQRQAHPAGKSLTSAALPAESSRVFEPENTSRELIAVTDSPELLDTENGLVRQVRYTYRERLGWTRPDTGARLEVEVPREDVYLLPVSLQ